MVSESNVSSQRNEGWGQKVLEDGFDILDEERETMVNFNAGGGSSVDKEVAKLSISNGQDGEMNPSGSGTTKDATKEAGGKDEEEDNDEYGDMADFENDTLLEDEAIAGPSPFTSTNNADNTNVLGVRSYNVSITYDKYYQTPRRMRFDGRCNK